MSVCSNLSLNNYICKDNKKGSSAYSINTTNPLLPRAGTNITISDTEIALSAKAKNHYFLADEKAHCSEKWQHWFCIPNYHNRNKIKNDPETDTMTIGKCYTYCKTGYTPVPNKIDKCSIGDDEDDLLFNPLAIIAMFGTNMYNKTTDQVIPEYGNIRDTIGIRGSYLNDLYRVNNNNVFITREQQDSIVSNTIDALLPIRETIGDYTSDLNAPNAPPMGMPNSPNAPPMGMPNAPNARIGMPNAPNAPPMGMPNARMGMPNAPNARMGMPNASNAPMGMPNAPNARMGMPNASNAPMGMPNAPNAPPMGMPNAPNAPMGMPNAPNAPMGMPNAPNAPMGMPNAPMGMPNVKQNSRQIAKYKIQEKIILNIIKNFRNKGIDEDERNMSGSIIAIKDDIKKATGVFIHSYIQQIKYSIKKQEKVLYKIKNYEFDMLKLQAVFGNDKNDKDRLKNAISYANIIMNLICKEGKTNVDTRIRQLFKFNNIVLAKKEEDNLIRIFKTACYNCFTVNYDVFKEYLQTTFATDGDTVFYNRSDAVIQYGDTVLYTCGISASDLDTVSSELQYNIPYYNNITFYDHQILSEYNDNEKMFVYILTTFGICLGFVVATCIIYAILLYIKQPKGAALTKIIHYVNYCSLFYSFVTNIIISLFSYLYYYVICRYSNSSYTIISLFFKIINIVIIVSLLSYSMNTILNLLNLSYCQASNDNTGNTSEENCGDSANMYYYMVYLYLIAIYIYSMYLMRYGRTDTEYDLLVNVDVEYQHSVDYIRLLLVEKYLTNIIAMFATYSKNELGIAKRYVPNVQNLQNVPMSMPQRPMSNPIGANPSSSIMGTALGTAGIAGIAGMAGTSLGNPSDALGKAGDFFNGSVGNVGNALGNPSDALGKAGDFFNGNVGNVGNALGNPSEALGKAGDFFNGNVGNVGNALGDPSEALGKAGDFFNGNVGNVGNALGDPSEALGKAGDFFNGNVDSVGNALGDPSEALGKAGDFFNGNVDTSTVSDLFSSIWGD